MVPGSDWKMIVVVDPVRIDHRGTVGDLSGYCLANGASVGLAGKGIGYGQGPVWLHRKAGVCAIREAPELQRVPTILPAPSATPGLLSPSFPHAYATVAAPFEETDRTASLPSYEAFQTSGP